jgi:nucleoside phosphorylase
LGGGAAGREIGRVVNAEAHTLVCFALKEEAEAFTRLTAGRQDIAILLTGIGRKNAEKTLTTTLKHSTPRCVLTCGFAGALDPGLPAGAVVFFTKDATLNQKLRAAGAKPAIFFCASRIATTAVEKQALRRGTGADAVEMESEAIHAVCRGNGIPCATVRVISDAADEDLPLDFNQFAKPDLSVDYGKLAWTVVKSPGKISALLRLQRQARECATRLSEVLSTIIANSHLTRSTR